MIKKKLCKRLMAGANGAQFLKGLKDEIEFPVLTLLQVGCRLKIMLKMEYWFIMSKIFFITPILHYSIYFYNVNISCMFI